MTTRRTALLIRCTPQEAEAIRSAAKRERRSISGFVLNAVMNRLANRSAVIQKTATRYPGLSQDGS
jgi:uncharacterized protein (DUF1778 family)